MLLDIVHETRYEYAPSVKTAQHMAHLKPSDRGGQQLIAHSLYIAPQPAHRSETVDVWGNTRTFFSLQSPHEALKVTARSSVATSAPQAITSAIAWDDARERTR